MIRSSNPALRASTFTDRSAASSAGSMTIQGTINKSSMLLLMVLGAAMFTWNKTNVALGAGTVPNGYLWVGILGGLATALVTIFKKTWAPVTAPLYAVFEGLFLGVFSAMMERSYPGIVSQAVFGTFGVFGALLFLYKSRIIRATEKFKLGVLAATGGIFLIYILSMILGLFGVNMPVIHSASPFGILFSVVVVGIAALNLILDFDIIEQGSKAGAPKYMEWYASFALLVTLIWLYLEIMRLLAKLNSRR